MSMSDQATREREDEILDLLERSRFLAVAGAALTGLATGRVLRAEPALARHNPVQGPCQGGDRSEWGACHYCDGSICTSYCSWPGPPHSHCPSGGQYWEVCTTNGNRYRCRDWHEKFPGYDSHHCVCRAGLGRC